ncbi:MAG: hypothetical protein IPN93_15300 [Bacteroidetes bacterium]|jgi:hypothetical protein|nr:hypothetical protein [Bacteroidota bacterium]MBK9353688.1 hypothetical protein [Bacteroidota bacterium]MBL0079166.1 hypothetical protein [Bacteroidota bacterium]MBL0288394.1 hypothetical protein [Bacteroidota bacterium]MBP7257338.1 hypothetical protein [Chitinophagales bacterium]
MTAEIGKKILDAHVAFELQQWEGANLISGMNGEIDALWAHLTKKKVKDIVQKQTIMDALDRNLKEIKLTKEEKEYFIDLYGRFHKEALESEYAVKDYLSKKNFDKIVKKVVALKDLRADLIKRAVNNPFYAEMISNTLYNGIKNFMNSEDGPASKITGSSLFKIGSGLLGGALSGIEDGIDKNVKKFLKSNLQKTLSQSESFMKEQLSDENIEKMASDAWDKLEDIEVSQMAKFISPKQATAFLPIIEDIWEELKKDGKVREIAEIAVDHFFEQNGDKKIPEFLQGLNIDREKIKVEASIIALPLIEKLKKEGFLEERIRTRLSKFYNSDVFLAI